MDEQYKMHIQANAINTNVENKLVIVEFSITFKVRHSFSRIRRTKIVKNIL